MKKKPSRRRRGSVEGRPVKPSREALQRVGGKISDGRSIPPHNIVVIGVDTSHGPGEHPLFADDAVALARSGAYNPQTLANFRECWVIEPVRVRLLPVAADDLRWPERWRGTEAFVAVVGRHRLLYARKVVEEQVARGDLKNVEARYVKCVLDTAQSTPGMTALTIVSENVHRRNVSPIELGRQVAVLLAADYSWEAIEGMLPYKRGQLNNFRVLAESGTPELHDALRRGAIKASKACQLAKLPHDAQREAVAEQPTAEGSEKPARLGRNRLKAAAERARDGALWTPREKELLAIVAGELPLEQTRWPELKELFGVTSRR